MLDAILDADGLIIATPIYSHQPAGALKAVLDSILGPSTDAMFARHASERKAAGDPKFATSFVDQRLLKPREAAFIAVGGSSAQDRVAMALPTLHVMIYSLHMKVVDQVVFQGFAAPGSVLAPINKDPTERARLLGRRLVSQLGKPFDEAQYLGDSPRDACPYCHLSKIELSPSVLNDVGCVNCGARGKFGIGKDGIVGIEWDETAES